jgi:predicted YcjX-like family ATPase
MSYLSGSFVRGAGTAALRARNAILGTRDIERVAFVATKADHVPALRRKNLENLLRDLVECAEGEQSFKGCPTSFHTVASVLSTRDGFNTVDGRLVEVVRGRVLGEDHDRDFFPGDVPSGRPPESFWSKPFFELPCFKPPRIDSTGQHGIPHLGVDQVMASLVGGAL